MSTNTWVGVGNLTRDPESRYTQGANPTTMCRFSIAINDGFGEKQETNFINVVAFGRLADNCIQYLGKGKKVAVTGRIKTGQYTSQQTGQKVYTYDIIASNVEFLTPSGQQDQFTQQSGFAQQSGFGQAPPQAAAPQGFAQPQQQSFAPPAQQPQQPQQQSFNPPQRPAQQMPDQQMQPPQGFTALSDDDVPF